MSLTQNTRLRKINGLIRIMFLFEKETKHTILWCPEHFFIFIIISFDVYDLRGEKKQDSLVF